MAMDPQYLQDLARSQTLLLQSLQDPCIQNKKAVWDQIRSLEQTLIQAGIKPYFCSKCCKIHRTGKKFVDHRGFAEIRIQLPEIQYPSAGDTINTQIVGIYYTGNGEYVQSLPARTPLELRPEPDNRHDAHAVSVWHDDLKLGYIPRDHNTPIFEKLRQGTQVECLLGHYQPSHTIYRNYFRRRHYSRHRRRYYDDDDWTPNSEFHPDRAQITIILKDTQKIMSILDGVCELIELGLEDLGEGFESLGIEALHILENHEQNSLHPNYKVILSKLYQKYQIPADEQSDFSILL
jgi:hypothetical protein